ncbi:hypothetical protein Dimus_037621, partial [Dionaea muscipula]
MVMTSGAAIGMGCGGGAARIVTAAWRLPRLRGGGERSASCTPTRENQQSMRRRNPTARSAKSCDGDHTSADDRESSETAGPSDAHWRSGAIRDNGDDARASAL